MVPGGGHPPGDSRGAGAGLGKQWGRREEEGQPAWRLKGSRGKDLVTVLHEENEVSVGQWCSSLKLTSFRG